MYRNTRRDRLKVNLLLKQDRKLFHTNDLAIIWGVSNRNTLYTTIKRYVQRGILTRICKGFYSTIDPVEIDSVVLGIGFLHRYAYLSTESVLVKKGIISQEVAHITLVSEISQKFQLVGNSYLARQMQEKFLYQTIGIKQKDDYNQATTERAVVDLLYFNPHYYLDGANLVDWGKVAFIQKRMGIK